MRKGFSREKKKKKLWTEKWKIKVKIVKIESKFGLDGNIKPKAISFLSNINWNKNVQGKQ